MKSLDYFISEPYLMDGMTVSSPSSPTATQTTQTDEQKEIAEAARQATKNADKTTEGVSSEPPATVDAKVIGGDAIVPGTKPNTADPANATSSSDSTTSNKTEDFTGAQKAPGGLETPLSGGFKMNPATGSISDKDGKVIDPKSEAYKALPEDVKAAVTANTLRLQASQERKSSDPASAEQAVQNEQVTSDAVTKPSGSSEGGDASTDDKSSTGETGEVAKTNEAEAQLSPEQEALKAQFDNYDPKANNGNGGTKIGGDSRALHFADDSKNTLLDCSNNDCKPGRLLNDGEHKGDYEFSDGAYLKGADVDAAYKASEAAKLADSNSIPDTPGDDTPIPQPALPDAVGAKGIEANGVKILNLNDSTNRDSGEAKNHLLDGQLNSTKNTFGTFTEGEGANAKHYMGFFSEGFGVGDERSGVVEIDANGKPKTDGNLGAGEGWKPASAEQKAKLQAAHVARTKVINELGGGAAGLAKLNEIQKLQGRIDNLQAYAHSDANKEHGLNNDHMIKLNEMMSQLNTDGATNLDTVKGSLNELVNADGAKLRGLEVQQKLNELKGQGFNEGEIAALQEKLDIASTNKTENSFSSLEKEINDSIDIRRDNAHALNGSDKAKFSETIKELEARGTLDDKQKAILDKLKGMAGNDGLDKMGKYLQTELKNLAAKVAPKPEPKKKDETRGDGDTIDFTNDAGAKAFREGLGGDEGLKKIFGDNYESNPSLKGVIEDFNSLSQLDGKDGKLKDSFLDALKAGDLDKIKNLQAEITKKTDDTSKKVDGLISNLTEANKAASQANDEAKKALEANKDEAKKAELEKAATVAKAAFDNSTKELTKFVELKKGLEPLKTLTAKYGKTEDGKLGITGADGKVTALKQDKPEVTPQDLAKINDELKTKIANGTAKAEEVQKYIDDNKIELTYHTAAGAKKDDGSAVCGPCDNNVKVATELAQLVGAGFKKIQHESLSNSGVVPRLEIKRLGRENQVVTGAQPSVIEYLRALIK